MNITEEANDYFSTTEKEDWIGSKYDTCITEESKIKSKKIKAYCKTELNKFEDILKDKLKTTPDRGIKKISKIFRVDWSKVFKRGWLLWK
jgi:5'(3')-deoxyribonucleotidase